MSRVNGFDRGPDGIDRLGVNPGLPRRSLTPQPYYSSYDKLAPPDASWESGSQQDGGYGTRDRRHSFNGRRGSELFLNVEPPSGSRSPSRNVGEPYDVPPYLRRATAPGDMPQSSPRAPSPSRAPIGLISQTQRESAVAPRPPIEPSTTMSEFIAPSQTSHVSKSDPFQYRELQENEFRLLRLLPERTSIIKCELVYANIEDPPPYTAVSYSWGDAENQQKIQIGADKISITTSLHGALKALRRQNDVIVWADGLCINQADMDERSKQVQLMAIIYSRAESVAVWLGPDADNSPLALRLIEDMAQHQNYFPNLKALVSSPTRRPARSAVVSLFERDYWERLWVVQEVFNARQVDVYCGEMVLPWDTFKAVGGVFRKYEAELKPYFVTDWSDDDRRLVSRDRLRYSHVLTHGGPSSFPDVESLTQLGYRTLLEVLYACRPKLAADPRDKVYAILGLLPPDIRDQFVPNYKLSVADVYINVVDFLLTTTKRIDVILETTHYPPHVSPIKLPTWVPDWSHIPQREAVPRASTFAADRNTLAAFQFQDERGNTIENAGSIIEIEGIKLDTIVRRGIAVDVLHGLEDYLMAFLHWRALLLGNHDDDGSDPVYTGLVREAFCRTLCQGQLPRGYGPSEWADLCYHIFACLLRERLPHLALDAELRRFAEADSSFGSKGWRKMLDEACHHSMQGRSFCLTKNGLIGIGTGQFPRCHITLEV